VKTYFSDDEIPDIGVQVDGAGSLPASICFGFRNRLRSSLAALQNFHGLRNGSNTMLPLE